MWIRKLALHFRKLDRFQIDPRYFPKNTRTLIPTPIMLKYGAIALGTKDGSILNIGLIDPYRLDSRDALSQLARDNGKRAHFYEVSVSDFAKALTAHFGIDTHTLKGLDIEPRLLDFLHI